MEAIDALSSLVLALPPLAKFAIAMAIIVGVPPLARRVGIPEMVGLLLFGVVLGPHVLGLFGEERPIANFFAELGKLLLMFSAGLEVDVILFRKAQTRSIIFGLVTTTVPLLLGTIARARLRLCPHSRDCHRVTARIPYSARSSNCPSARCPPTRADHRDNRRHGSLGHTLFDRVRDLRFDLYHRLLAGRACHPTDRDRRLRSVHSLRP